MTSAESKAAYQEIKDYVLEHSGRKVSSLYIAQANRNVVSSSVAAIISENLKMQSSYSARPKRKKQSEKH